MEKTNWQASSSFFSSQWPTHSFSPRKDGDILLTAFDSRTEGNYPALFQVEPSASSPSKEACISFYRDVDMYFNDLPSIYVTVKGNTDTAKKTVEKAVEHFSNKESFTTKDITQYLILQSKQQQKTTQQNHSKEAVKKTDNVDRQIETARKAGYVQGVCECVAAIGDDHTLGKKLLTEMNVTKDMAKKYANPQTFKTLEQGIFAPKPEQKLEQTQGFKR